MLIKLPDESVDDVNALIRATSQRTAAGAYRYAARRYAPMQSQIDQLQGEVTRLRNQLLLKDQVIDRARESAAALLDHVAQGDLLSD